MNMEACQQTLHYQGMGIHMTLMMFKKESQLRRALEESLANQDWSTLELIQSCYSRLGSEIQTLLLSGMGHPLKIADAIAQLEMRVYQHPTWKELQQAREVMGLPILC